MKKFLMMTILAASGFLSIAQAGELAVVVGANSPTASMNADQVSQIFLGKSSTLVPIDQNEGTTKTEFYKKVADKELSQVKSIWSKIAFTGKGVPPKEVGGNAEVKKQLASDPKAIGYIDKSAVDGTVKVILSVQ
jgi:ABC-type phosphate transport system substrate-binding protein